MSIKYSLTRMRKLINPEEPPLYYAKAQVREVVTLQTICKEITWGTTLTAGDAENAFLGVAERSAHHLQNGRMVNLGGLGKIQFQLSSQGAPTREEFTRHNIRKPGFASVREGCLKASSTLNYALRWCCLKRLWKKPLRGNTGDKKRNYIRFANL